MMLWWGWENCGICYSGLHLGFIKDWIEADAGTAVTVAMAANMITTITVTTGTGTAAASIITTAAATTITIAVSTRTAAAVTSVPSVGIAFTGIRITGTASTRNRSTCLCSALSFGLGFSLAFGDLEASGMLDLHACATLDVVAIIATIIREAILGEYVC